MKEQFEQAYFRYLNDLAYKSAMIECGVSAMLQGFETENVVLLSGADSEREFEVVELFIGAAKELAISLPNESEKDEWKAEKSVRYLLSDSSPSHLDIDSQFYRNLLVGYSKLKEHPEIVEYVKLLQKFVIKNSHIEDYENWLNDLNSECKKLQQHNEVSHIEKKLIFDITDVISGVSYGGVDNSIYQMSFEVAIDALRITHG